MAPDTEQLQRHNGDNVSWNIANMTSSIAALYISISRITIHLKENQGGLQGFTFCARKWDVREIRGEQFDNYVEFLP